MKLRLQLILAALLLTVSNLSADIAVLNFYADGQRILSVDVDANPATPYVLADILTANGKSVSGCREYNFVGWKTGGPVVGDESPTIVTTVSPSANMNLYAVYQKEGAAANRYKRITSTKDLHAGEQYVLACYYEWDGDIYYGPSYFAMKNTQSISTDRKETNYYLTISEEYYYLYAYIYRISATQIYPDAGILTNPDNSIVWALSGTEDNWAFTSAADANIKLTIRENVYRFDVYYGNRWQIYDTPDNQLLTTTGNTFSITASNGKFNFISGDYRLTYSDDATDYFTTGYRNDWSFYLYKQESAFTSFPNCVDWTVHLDAGDGTIGETGLQKDDLVDHSGAGVVLPTATKPAGLDCEAWMFVGWTPETPIKGQTRTPKLYAAGSVYKPTFDGETLYAVYQVHYYTEVTRKTNLNTTDTYVIVYDGNKAVTYNNSNTSWSSTAVTITGDAEKKLTSSVEAEMFWRYSSGYFYCVNDDNAHRLRANGTSGNLSDNSPFTFSYTTGSGYGKKYYYLKWGGANFAYTQSNQSHTYRIYKKVLGAYSSYPHCSRYTMHWHACGGTMTIDGKTRINVDTTEVSIAAGIILPKPVPLCPDSGWVFLGWLEGGELDAIEDVECTGLTPAGERFIPSHDDTHLYAVYERKINKFRVVSYPENMVPGDNYVFAFYGDGNYNWEMTSTPAETPGTLVALQQEARQDAGGYYITIPSADTTAAMWKLGGMTDAWTFYNIKTQKYLNVNTANGNLTTDAVATTFYVRRPDVYLNLRIYYYQSSIYYGIYHDGTAFTTDDTYLWDACMLYRQMREYASWPHCDPFTVIFNAGDGTAGATSLTEDVAYQGVTLPNAYANSDCSKEGWTFAGWATAPVTDESDVLTIDIFPAGMIYHPTLNNVTLYAVYYVKENTYRKINDIDDLRTGINYIIATSDNYALSNEEVSNNYIASETVNPQDGVISTENTSLAWRIQGIYGSYELFNSDNNVYLDLRSYDGYAHLTSTLEDNFYITHSGGRFLIRSNRNRSPWDGRKYLGFETSYFNTVAEGSQPNIYFYQQEAVYNSYPSCVSDVDVVKWEKADENVNYVTIESYVQSGEPGMDGASGHATDQAVGNAGTEQDGTWVFKYTTSSLAPCTQTTISWGDKTADVRIPYIINANVASSVTPGETDCRTCDLVVMSGKTYTIDTNMRLHMVTVQEGATLNISDGATLTVNSLVLDANSDQNAPIVNLNNTGAIVLKNGELYYDLRIPEDRFYWISLPFASQTQEVSYSNVAANGGAPVYNEDFFIYYYDGASRAADANAGSVQDTYWKVVADDGVDYTMQAGHGHLFGILDQKNIEQKDGRYHTKRVMRFTMRPPVATWLTQEHTGGSKTTTVVPSACTDTLLAFHAGWNLVGNPYMHTYNTGTVSGEGGLSNGAWKKEIKNAVWTGSWVLDDGRPAKVPYITVFNPAATDEYPYSQSLASNFTLRPFQAVFIQVNDGNSLNFLSSMAVPASAPAYKRFIQEEGPVRTGITLNGAGRSDRTGVVLSEEYTTRYEIGADLQKMLNGGLNLYTLNADNQQLAFNGLSEEDAVAPIPVGVTLPAAGEYTFAFDAEQYSLNVLDTLMLIDYTENKQIDLRYQNYTFTAAKGKNEGRFALLIRLAKVPQIETNLDETYDPNAPRKIIRDGILFIIRDDKMYNALGAEVK